jgi:hypothetical protein
MASLDDKETLLKIGIAIDETQFQQKVASAIGEAEKMKEVRIPINVDGKDGIRVIRSYRDEMNNLIKTTQDFIMAKNGLVGAKNEKIVDVSTIKKAESAYDALIAKIQKYDAEVTKDNTNTKRTVASYDELKQSMELVSEGGIKAITYEGQNLYQREVQLKDANTGLIQTYTQLSTNGQNWTSTLTNIDKATVQNNTHIDALTSKIKSLDPTFNSLTGKGKTIVSDIGEETKGLKVLSATTSNVVHQGELLKKTTTEYGDSAKGTKKVIETYTDQHGKLVNVLKSTTERTRDLGVGLSNFKGTLIKVAQFKLMTDTLNLVTQSMSQAIDMTFELDSALTDFKKVSDLSGDSLTEYVGKLTELGEETARTTTEMIQASTVFKQAGYSDEDSAQLAQMATMLQNISDTEISAGEAGSFLISQIKAFDSEFADITSEGAKAQKVMDGLNEVSNNFAVSSSDLEQGLANVASTMASSGTTYEQTLGMLTAIVERTRNANKASRGLK